MIIYNNKTRDFRGDLLKINKFKLLLNNLNINRFKILGKALLLNNRFSNNLK